MSFIYTLQAILLSAGVVAIVVLSISIFLAILLSFVGYNTKNEHRDDECYHKVTDQTMDTKSNPVVSTKKDLHEQTQNTISSSQKLGVIVYEKGYAELHTQFILPPPNLNKKGYYSI